ncbi:tetratricopeptide repeat protein [Chloroflexota bacterium]
MKAQNHISFSRAVVALVWVVANAIPLWFAAPVAETGVAASNEGFLFTNIGEYHKAIAAFTRAIELDPTLAIAYSNRGWAHINLEQYDQAIADCTKAIELDPTLAMAYNNRSWAYIELGQYEQAIDDYNRAIELDPSLQK